MSRRDERVAVLLTADELAALTAYAERVGVSLGTAARILLRDALSSCGVVVDRTPDPEAAAGPRGGQR